MKFLQIVVDYGIIKLKLSYDKDVFRESKGNLLRSYKEIIKRLKLEEYDV